MKRIAILNCLKANDVCAGAACLKAFNSRSRHFEQYGAEPIELVAMGRCNGCEVGIDEGFQEKLDRIIEEGAEVCHLGVCTIKSETRQECKTITEAANYLETHGVQIVRGTH
jgi:predicted metal-binding protein